MARSEQPASPALEVAVCGDRVAEGSPLTAELAAFVQSGISIILAAVGRDGRPVACIGLACRVTDDGTVRLIGRRPALEPVLDAIDAGAGVAATFSRPETHRSIQLKAPSATESAADDQDRAAATMQAPLFRRELISVDHDEIFAELFVSFDPAELTVVEFRPERAFVQTPGPGAGAELPR